MSAMTPMKAILVDKKTLQIWIEDRSDRQHLCCTTANLDELFWLSQSLSAYHNRPIEYLDEQ